MAEDDLGAFFSEIEQIEKILPIEEEKEEEKVEERIISTPIEIVSKPQIIKRQSEKISSIQSNTIIGTSSNSYNNLETNRNVRKYLISFYFPIFFL